MTIEDTATPEPDGAADEQVDTPADASDAVENDQWPYSITPDWVTLAPISSEAKEIYSLLRAYANKERGGDTAFPHQKTLARLLGYSKTQPINAMCVELESIGALRRWRKPYRGGRRTIYRTYLQPHPDANYSGPRRTSDLSDAEVLAALVAARPPRRRGGPDAALSGAADPRRRRTEHVTAEEDAGDSAAPGTPGDV